VNVTVRSLSWVNDLPSRDLGDIRLVVIHATEEPELEDARNLAENSEDLVSGHFYIDRDGTVEEWVPITRVARHTRGHNRKSVGIELVNLGRYPDHFSSTRQVPNEPFPEEQISSLEWLLQQLRGECPKLSDVELHSRLDVRNVRASDDASLMVRRRVDPGPLFPWPRVESAFLRAK
jgi:N-acetylmuramoyl-L-alanine amidase